MVVFIGTDAHEAGRAPPPVVNMYPHLRFAPYRHIEFPMWVQRPGLPETEENRVLVRDEEEKANILMGAGEMGTPREADEKLHLYALAEEKGIHIDKRWNMDTVRLKVLGPNALADAG